jgi:hypothetical protein
MQKIIFEIEKQIWETVSTENRIGVPDVLSGIALFYNSLVEKYNCQEY